VEFSPTEGQPWTGVVAHFTDADPNGSRYQATIDWGNGTVTPNATITTNSQGSYDISGGVTYYDETDATQPLTVTVRDNEGRLAVVQGGPVPLVDLQRLRRKDQRSRWPRHHDGMALRSARLPVVRCRGGRHVKDLVPTEPAVVAAQGLLAVPAARGLADDDGVDRRDGQQGPLGRRIFGLSSRGPSGGLATLALLACGRGRSKGANEGRSQGGIQCYAT